MYDEYLSLPDLQKILELSSHRPMDTVQGVPEKRLSCLNFCVRVAPFKLDFLRDACAESWAFWARP